MLRFVNDITMIDNEENIERMLQYTRTGLYKYENVRIRPKQR